MGDEQYFNRMSEQGSEGKPARAAGGRPAAVVEKVQFPDLEAVPGTEPLAAIGDFSPVPLTISAELGKAHLKVKDLINLKEGSVIKLDKPADESVTLLANQTPFALGEVVVINERFGIRLTSFLEEKK